MGGRACPWGGKRWVGRSRAMTADGYSPSLGSLWGSNPLLWFLDKTQRKCVKDMETT